MSAFPNYEFQNQQGAEDNGANNPTQVPPQQQAPPMAQPSDSGPAPFQGAGADPGSAGGPQAGGDAKTTLWSVGFCFLHPLPGWDALDRCRSSRSPQSNEIVGTRSNRYQTCRWASLVLTSRFFPGWVNSNRGSTRTLCGASGLVWVSRSM